MADDTTSLIWYEFLHSALGKFMICRAQELKDHSFVDISMTLYKMKEYFYVLDSEKGPYRVNLDGEELSIS